LLGVFRDACSRRRQFDNAEWIDVSICSAEVWEGMAMLCCDTFVLVMKVFVICAAIPRLQSKREGLVHNTHSVGDFPALKVAAVAISVR
jgi:hypothetical protein